MAAASASLEAELGPKLGLCGIDLFVRGREIGHRLVDARVFVAGNPLSLFERGWHDRPGILEADQATDVGGCDALVAVGVICRDDREKRTGRNGHGVVRIAGIQMLDRQILDHAAGNRRRDTT